MITNRSARRQRKCFDRLIPDLGARTIAEPDTLLPPRPSMHDAFRCAVIQAPPVFLNLQASVERACDLMGDARNAGAEVVSFGETWLAGYPVWIDTAPRAAMWGDAAAKAVYRRLFEQSPALDGPEVATLHARAEELGCDLVIGLNERSSRTLFNTILMLGRDGRTRVHRRKLVPTYSERMIWGRGDGSTLGSLETPRGRLGGMICWEHWMPALRMVMHAEGELVHVAQWPAAHELHQLASRQYAFEGGCFVLCCGTSLTREEVLDGYRSLGADEGLDLLESIEPDQLLTGGSAIIGPDTAYLAGPAGAEEQIVLAEIDPARTREASLLLDTDGHYSRPDIFRLHVDRSAHQNVVDRDR
jgi:nitrilase